MLKAYKSYWHNFVNFKGRATRKEFWWSAFVNFMIVFLIAVTSVAIFVFNAIKNGANILVIWMYFAIVIIILICLFCAWAIITISIGLRRFHDLGVNWISYATLVALVIAAGRYCYIPLIVILILACLPANTFSKYDNFLIWHENDKL